MTGACGGRGSALRRTLCYAAAGDRHLWWRRGTAV